MNNTMLWVFLICNAMCIFAFTITPFVTRKTEQFGVSLPSSEIGRTEISAFRRRYLLASLCLGVLLIVLTILVFSFTQNEMIQVKWFLILIFAYIAAGFLIYLYFHRMMKKFKAAQPWRLHGLSAGSGAGSDIKTGSGYAGVSEPVLVVDTQPPKREVLHPAWLLLFAAIAAGTLLYLWYIWPSLPDRIPIHMDAAGVADGWTDKGPGAFVTLLSGQWIIIVIFTLVYFMIPLTKRQIDAARPAESREQGRRFRYIMSACMVFFGAALAMILGYLPLAMARGGEGITLAVLPVVLILVLTVFLLIIIFRTGQGGSRLKVGDEQTGQTVIKGAGENVDDDRYWKLGQFYFNPKDPAIFVEKRFGIGWTTNFGHPVSWIMLIAIIVVVVISLVFAFQV